MTLSTYVWTAQRLPITLSGCNHGFTDCSDHCDLQERPVTKEVTTYVQERHPVAKQVGSNCVQSPRTGPAFRAQSGPSDVCVHTPPLSSVHTCGAYIPNAGHPDCSMWWRHVTQGRNMKWLEQPSSRLLVTRKDTSLVFLLPMATETCTCDDLTYVCLLV